MTEESALQAIKIRAPSPRSGDGRNWQAGLRGRMAVSVGIQPKRAVTIVLERMRYFRSISCTLNDRDLRGFPNL